MKRYLTELLKGNTDVMVLALLREESMYGYQLMKALEQRSNGFFRVSEGTLYPALHRLVRDGLLDSRWVKLPAGQERRYYSLTDKGDHTLHERCSTWSGFADAMNRVVAPSLCLQ